MATRKDYSSEFDDVFQAAADAYGVDADILKGIAYNESRFRPDIIEGQTKSPVGAIGMMQFMPETAKEYGINPLDPVEAITGAAAYLRKSLDRFNGDYGRAVAAYNWGPNRKAYQRDDWIKAAPLETQNYVIGVLEQADKYKSLRPQPVAQQEEVPPDDSGFLKNIGRLATEGGEKALSAAQVGPSVVAGTTGVDSAGVISKQLSKKQAPRPKELIEAQQAFADEQAAYEKAKGFSESAGPVLGMFAELGKQIITNPKGAAYLTAESAAYMIPAILGTYTGAKGAMALTAPTANPAIIGGAGVVGGITGGFAGQAPVEAGSEFISIVSKELQSRGLQPTENNVKALLSDKRFVEQAISDARTKGMTTAAVDSITTMVGGRFATGAKRAATSAAMKELGAGAKSVDVAKRAEQILAERSAVQKVARPAGGVGIDVVGGGASEAAGQAAAYGEVDLADVGLEMLGELGGTAAEIPSVAYATAEKKIKSKPAEEQPPVPPTAKSQGKPQGVATLPGTTAEEIPGAISQTELDRITADYPVGIRETVRRQLSGRTMDELRAIVESNPEILQDESLGAQAIRSLLGLQPGREAERPTAPTVTETPSGITPPEAEQAAPQGAQPETTVGAPEPGAEAGAAPAPVETAGVAQTWTEMDRAQREQMAVRAGLKQVPATEAAAKPWSRLTKEQKDKIAGVMQVEPAPLATLPEEATAEQEQMPIPAPEMKEEQAALESLEKQRRKILRAPGGNLRTALMGTLPADEVRDISPDFSMRQLQARADKAPTSLSTLVANGSLNEFLPFEMRNDSPSFDETDSVEYIKERLRQKNHYTYETNFALEQIGLQIAEIEAAMREHLTLRETNLLIQEAADEQRRIDEEVETATAQAAPGTVAPAQRVAPAPELTAEEEARLEREAIQAESEEAASRLSPTTPAALKAAEDRAKAAEKEAEQARKEADKAEAEAKKERERREIAEASVKAAEDFQLGQSAEDNLSGQRDLLQQERPVEPKAIKFYEDIPNESWLQGKLDYVTNAPRNQFGVPKMASITGYFSQPVLVPARFFDGVKGQRGEQDNVRQESLDAIRKIIRETGKMPLTEDGKEYVPYVEIAYNGEPYISEGNHRIMAAIAEGMKYIPIELRYFDGGQRRAGKWNPDNLKEITERVRQEGGQRDLLQQVEQSPAIESAAFKRWFGNSKVVDENGEPLVVYHGTPYGGFASFDPTRSGTRDTFESARAGIYFSKTPRYAGAMSRAADETGPSIYPVYLSIKNPLRVFSTELTEAADVDAMIAEAKDGGHDGIIDEMGNFVVFSPNQIKSATGNRGTFDPNSANITEARTAQGGWSIDPEEQRIEKELTGKTFDQLTDWAVDNAPDAYAKEIAQKVQKRLREFAKAGVKLNFDLQTGKTRSRDMFGVRGKVSRIAKKDKPVELTLSLNGAAAIENQSGYAPGMRYSTVLHELIHAATELHIQMSPNSPQVRALNDLRNKIVKHFNDRVKAGTLTDFERKIYDNTNNALRNADEVLAWGLTDREMQEFLADVKIDDRSLFDRFVDIVRNILGLDRPYKSALEELIRTADSLLDITTEQIEKDVTAKGYLFGPPSGPTTSVVAAPMSQGELFQQEQTIEERAQRENVFGNGTISTWTYPTEVKIIGNTNRDDVIYSLQDKQVDTKRVVEAIRATPKEIGSKWDPYLQETLFHGRTAKQTQDFLNKELEPALEEMRKRGITKAELGEYMHNRHAPEANAVIAARNPRFPDGGSGIKTADARRYMSELSPKKRADLEATAAKFDQILQGTRDLIVASRMESPETVEAWEEMYSNYIPLVRADADYSVNKGMSQGAGYSVSGKTTKGRTGSEREVVHDEILANIAMQRELAIVRAQKNRVAQAVFGLAVQNPNPGFWLALDPSTNAVWQANETQDALDLLREIVEDGDLSPEQAKQYDKEIRRLEGILKKQGKQSLAALDKLREDFTELGLDPADIEKNIMKPPLKPRYDPKTNKVVYESRASFSNPHVFSAKINGSDKFVLFNANNPRAKRMAEALKGMDADTLGRTMSMIAKVTRYFAAINTQYNPIFGAYNFLRDVQAAILQITTTPIADKKKQVVAGTGPAMTAIYRSTRATTKKRQGKEGEWDRLWEEFQIEGGQTGFRDQFSQSAERAEALQKMLDPASWAESPMGKVFTANGTLKVPFETARKTIKPVFDWLSDYNTTMENAVRLSAYKVAKEKFLSEGRDLESAKQEAARVAKELTVNFNRKGQVATQMGALYAFFNAAVQGTTRMLQTLRGPAGKKILGGAFLLGSMQAMWLAAAGFDEDEPPEFIKERNIIIPVGGGKYVAIPLPLGFNFLPNLSRILTETAIAGYEGRPLNIAKRVEQVAGSFLDMFNPIGNAGWSVQTISPTIADPIVALFENKDWTGKPIAKEDMSGLDPSPGYTRAKESATWLSEQLAYYLNLASGGTDAKRGIISPTPDQLDYLGGQLTGGLGREVGKVVKTVESQITGEELPQYNIPVWGRFFGDITSTANVSTRFYDNITKLNEHQAEIKSLREKRENVQEYFKDNPEARLFRFADTVYRDVSQLRKQRRELVEAGAPKERIKRIEERITNRMRQLNKRVEEAEKR